MAVGAYLFASGCSFEGGSGIGWVCGFLSGTCIEPSVGGIGLLVDPGGTVDLVDSTFVGGRGSPDQACGASGAWGCSGAPDGAALVGSVNELSQAARTCEVEDPLVMGGGTYCLSIAGPPGELAFTLHADRALAAPMPLFSGAQLVAFPLTVVSHGAIPASGPLEKDVPVPPLLEVAAFQRTFVQSLLFDALANAYLTSGSVLVVVP